jgi:lysylphosphatidylglycerol synthetase-like protein (DUF2156 family)
MALGTVRIQGGDSTFRGWVASTQVTTAAAFLTKLLVFVPTANSTQVLWLFNTATGATDGLNNPTVVLICPNGVTTTLDFGDYGKIFRIGLYFVVATNEPASAADAPTPSADNSALVTMDYKLK